jgi:hypothetical protein
VRIPLRELMSVPCKCGVLSGRGLNLQKSPTNCGVSKCHGEVSKMKVPLPTSGYQAKEEKSMCKIVNNKECVIIVC